MRRLAIGTMGLVGLWVALPASARAHNGRPFPIVMNQPQGAYVISVWTDPDVGVGKFFVILEPASGTTLPDENEVEVCVQPTSGRLAEACYQAVRQSVRS